MSFATYLKKRISLFPWLIAGWSDHDAFRLHVMSEFNGVFPFRLCTNHYLLGADVVRQ